MSDPTNYGNFYWCVHVVKELAAKGEIYLYADHVDTKDDGSLWFYHKREEGFRPGLVIGPGLWQYFYAASIVDGAAVAVAYWPEEVDR